MSVTIDYDKGDNLPAMVVKYISSEFLETTLAGYLKFGALSDYRGIEASSEKRLSDPNEGRRVSLITRDIINEDIVLPGMNFRGATMMGNGLGSVRHEIEFDSLVFCVVSGDYSLTHHKAFMDRGNESVKSYIVYDTQKLILAILDFFSTILKARSMIVVDKVIYDDNKKIGEVPLIAKGIDENDRQKTAFKDAVFSKNSVFAYEEEIRFALWSGDKQFNSQESLFVRGYRLVANLNLFQNAVLYSGTVK